MFYPTDNDTAKNNDTWSPPYLDDEIKFLILDRTHPTQLFEVGLVCRKWWQYMQQTAILTDKNDKKCVVERYALWKMNRRTERVAILYEKTSYSDVIKARCHMHAQQIQTYHTPVQSTEGFTGCMMQMRESYQKLARCLLAIIHHLVQFRSSVRPTFTHTKNDCVCGMVQYKLNDDMVEAYVTVNVLLFTLKYTVHTWIAAFSTTSTDLSPPMGIYVADILAYLIDARGGPPLSLRALP